MIDPPATTLDLPPRTAPPIRLAFGSLFWRTTSLAFLVIALVSWRWLRRNLRMVPGPKRLAMLVYLLPRSFFRAMLIGALVAVAADLFVRLALRPLVARWFQPRRAEEEFGTPIQFHLSAHETVRAQLPARRASGRFWAAGTLLLTDRRLWFFPMSWNAEPWSVPLDRLARVRVVPPPRMGLGFIKGMPDRIAVTDDRGVETLLAVADPTAVLDWLGGHGAPQFLHLDGP